jgi:carboxymethylenebutenolidase
MTMIEIPAADGAAQAYVVRPDQGAHPGVLFFIDAIGLRPRIEEMAETIASWGYVVLAPNLFYRSGTAEELAPSVDLRLPGERERFFATVMPRVRAFSAALMDADTTAYLSALRALPGVSAGPVGATGYCMGARFVTRAAGAHPEDVAAAGGFHGGGLVTGAEDSPHLSLATARAEFVFGHADRDRSMPAEAVETLGRTLAEHGLTAKNQVYDGASHGYSMSDTSAYDEAATERAFAELRALFARAL